MAVFVLTSGAPVGPGFNGNAQNEAQLAQEMVNEMAKIAKVGMGVAYSYDDSARTLTVTYSGTAA